MAEELRTFLEYFQAVPLETVYLVIGAGAAVENLFPPIPSDAFVLLGGVLADRELLRWELVLLVAWASNLAMAIFVYLMGLRYGRAIFDTRWGSWLLRPHQLQQLSVYYGRYGSLTILVSRFFPVFRVLVPAFAGISRLGFWRTALPLAAATGVWYGALVFAGIFASRNLPRIFELFETVNVGLLAAALVIALLVGLWWWRSRRSPEPRGGGGEETEGGGS